MKKSMGMLWMLEKDTKQNFEEKVERAKAYFVKKYATIPTCLVIRSVEGDISRVADMDVVVSDDVQAGHVVLCASIEDWKPTPFNP